MLTDQSRMLMLAVVVVAFVAGYAIVSFVVRKLKEGPLNPELTGSHRQQDGSARERETSDAGRRSDQED